ncbi:hypothetical protein RQM47_12885 [Rubrivirga sp. S365]|uniref:hypothetical protein n=1 Tax=Rubrivirga sp. S365 TaxID=3076080 RepID=UPI0028CAE9D7|nr:hypothetical protein [Rubrivirga sp. S365]MDT7857540.1 hypothetical protein [Rubrivirga sp. S365]
MRPLLVVVLALLPALAAGQPLAFGSSSDVMELGSGPLGDGPAPAVVVGGVYGGPAYLPDTWRGAVRAEVEAARGRFSLGVGTTVHPAAGGLYDPEADEAYDALRAVRYVRLNPTATSRLYARLGPTERMTLGTGALVRGYRTTTAYDERTLGAEAAVAGRRLTAGAFVDDLRLNGVVGGEASLVTGLRLGPARDLALGLTVVHDLGAPGLSGDSSLTGAEATVRGLLFGDGVLSAAPFVTAGGYLGHGGTVGGGVDLATEDLNGLRARARAAVFVSSADFVPGYVGPFYTVSNASDRIVVDRTFFDDDADIELAGTPLDSLSGGVDLVLDLGVVAFGSVEVSQHVRRHLGPDDASAYGIRVAGRVVGGPRLAFELQREGFRGLIDLLFRSLGDQNALVLDVGVPVGRAGEVFVRSRYGYRLLTAADGVDEPGRFLVERRFEPLVGLRVVLD